MSAKIERSRKRAWISLRRGIDFVSGLELGRIGTGGKKTVVTNTINKQASNTKEEK